MSVNWEDDLRRDRRRVRVLWATGLLLVVLLGIPIGIVLTQHRGNRSAALRTLPGYRDGGRAVDTTPFSTFAPELNGSTTIPGGPTGDDDTDTTTNSPWNPTAATTTTEPLPQIPAGDDACLALQDMRAFFTASDSLQRNPAAFAQASAQRMTNSARLLSETDPRRYRNTIDLLHTAAAELTKSTSIEQVKAVMTPLSYQSTPQIQAAIAPLIDHARSACPGLTQTGV